MTLKNIIGKTVILNADACDNSRHITGIMVDDGYILRSDGHGWESTSLEAKARALGVALPADPTFWCVAPHWIAGVLSPLSDFEPVAAPAAPVIPAEPIEPTAPMTAQVLQMLRKKGDVTTIEAQGVLRCRSLSKRITELKRMGHKITRTLHEDHTGQRYARYILAA
jgi:hypothetical protein